MIVIIKHILFNDVSIAC